MSKKPGFTRTTISLPADLKKRMDKVAEAVNWSAIAARAFEGVLAEHAARKERKNMNDVIQRLRASKQQCDDENYKDGFLVGQEWAKNSAEARELQNLDRVRSSIRDDEWTFETDESSAYGAWEWLYFQMFPEHDRERVESEGFWAYVLKDEDDPRRFDAGFLRGFAEGALDIWNQVKNQL